MTGLAALDPVWATVRGVAGTTGAATDYGPDGIQARADLARSVLIELDRVVPTSPADRAAATFLRGRLRAELASVDAGEPLRALRAPFGLLVDGAGQHRPDAEGGRRRLDRGPRPAGRDAGDARVLAGLARAGPGPRPARRAPAGRRGREPGRPVRRRRHPRPGRRRVRRRPAGPRAGRCRAGRARRVRGHGGLAVPGVRTPGGRGRRRRAGAARAGPPAHAGRRPRPGRVVRVGLGRAAPDRGRAGRRGRAGHSRSRSSRRRSRCWTRPTWSTVPRRTGPGCRTSTTRRSSGWTGCTSTSRRSCGRWTRRSRSGPARARRTTPRRTRRSPGPAGPGGRSATGTGSRSGPSRPRSSTKACPATTCNSARPGCWATRCPGTSGSGACRATPRAGRCTRSGWPTSSAGSTPRAGGSACSRARRCGRPGWSSTSACTSTCRCPGRGGRHGERWTFEVASEVLRDRGRIAPHRLHPEVVRYCGWPAQATAYKLGERAWLAARDDARARLGAGFDLKRWHTAALALGPGPAGRPRGRPARGGRLTARAGPGQNSRALGSSTPRSAS